MTRRVVWTESAKAEFVAIIDYIAKRNPDAAAHVAARIDRAATALSDYSTGRAGRVTGTYEKPVQRLPYILAYEIMTETAELETVAILHIIHGARDWPSGAWPRD